MDWIGAIDETVVDGGDFDFDIDFVVVGIDVIIESLSCGASNDRFSNA